MLQFGNLTGNITAPSENSFAFGMEPELVAELMAPLSDVGLEFQGEIDLGALDDSVRLNEAEEIRGGATGHIPYVLGAPTRRPDVMSIDIKVAAKIRMKLFDDGSVGHADADEQIEADVNAVGLRPLVHADVAFAIEETGGVANFKHQTSLSVRWNGDEFGENPMPGRKVRKDNPEPSRGSNAPGVCNEQVSPAKAKVCSELGRNAERSAETSGPVSVVIRDNIQMQVTDCQTKYILYRPHSKREMVPLDPKRFSVNQDAFVILIGWAGNMTARNRQLQGVIVA